MSQAADLCAVTTCTCCLAGACSWTQLWFDCGDEADDKYSHAATDQHLIGTQTAIAIQITALEPVIQSHVTALILFTHDEPDKILIPHFARLFCPERPTSLQGHAGCSGYMGL